MCDARSGKGWRRHIRTFYRPFQYIGALVIIAGLVLSSWPALVGGEGAGPALWDLVFFLANGIHNIVLLLLP